MSVENLVVRTAASAGFGTGGWLIAQSLDKKQDTIVDLDLDDIPGDIFKGNIEMSSDDLVFWALALLTFMFAPKSLRN